MRFNVRFRKGWIKYTVRLDEKDLVGLKWSHEEKVKMYQLDKQKSVPALLESLLMKVRKYDRQKTIRYRDNRRKK